VKRLEAVLLLTHALLQGRRRAIKKEKETPPKIHSGSLKKGDGIPGTFPF
jgi:hypothetical protein